MEEANNVETVSEKVEEKKLLKKVSRTSLIIGTVVIVLFLAIGFFVLLRFNSNLQIVKNAQKEVYVKSNESDFVGVQQAATRGLTASPQNKYLLVQMVTAIASEGNETGKESQVLKKAEPYIKTLQEVGKNDVNALIALGYINEVAGKYNSAITFYNQALAIDNKNALAHFHRGHAYEFLDREDIAFMDYDTAYQLDPNDPLILLAKGRENVMQGKLNNAYDFYIKASKVQNAPRQLISEALADASIVKRANLAYLQEAIDLSKQAVIIDPSYSPALSAYGYNLYLNVQRTEAIKYVVQASKLNPRIAVNYWIIGLILQSDKQFINAITYFNQALGKVNNDNTVLGSKAKNNMKGNIAYDLARTYYLNQKDSPYILKTLKYAIAMNSSIKTTLKNDYTGPLHLFAELSQNSDFQKLLK